VHDLAGSRLRSTYPTDICAKVTPSTIVFGDTRFRGRTGSSCRRWWRLILSSRCWPMFVRLGHFVPIPDTPTIDIVPGHPAVWQAVLPSLRRPGERFHFGLKSEDQLGKSHATGLCKASIQGHVRSRGVARDFRLSAGEARR
jgi:hypothetical protein